jgi:hypothetical protein
VSWVVAAISAVLLLGILLLALLVNLAANWAGAPRTGIWWCTGVLAWGAIPGLVVRLMAPWPLVAVATAYLGFVVGASVLLRARPVPAALIGALPLAFGVLSLLLNVGTRLH